MTYLSKQCCRCGSNQHQTYECELPASLVLMETHFLGKEESQDRNLNEAPDWSKEYHDYHFPPQALF